MPGGDRTGPLGQGPGTGRAFGYCYGYDSPGYTKGPGRGMGRGLGFGRGMGRGRSFGRGWSFGVPYQGYNPGYPWMSPMNKEDEIKLLKSEADALNRSREKIEKRLEELEKEE
jgi:hypothetical protein